MGAGSGCRRPVFRAPPLKLRRDLFLQFAKVRQQERIDEPLVVHDQGKSVAHGCELAGLGQLDLP
jgi:hypothetical protein